MSIRRLVVSILAVVSVSVLAVSVWGNTPPTADFTAYRVRDALEAEILLDASASSDSDGEIINYQWVFGDGTTGSGISVVHTYSSLGMVTITLLAYDDGGSWHLVTKTIDLSLTSLAPQGAEPAGSATGTTDADPTTPMATEQPAVTTSTAPIGHFVGNRAPDFALSDPDGNTVKLSDFLGHVVLIEFWKSTCGGCQAHTPQLDEYRRTYTEQGLVVLLIVLDLHMSTAQRYLRDRGYTELILLHETRPYTAGTLASYGVPGTPFAVLVDRAGEIQFAGYAGNVTTPLIESLL